MDSDEAVDTEEQDDQLDSSTKFEGDRSSSGSVSENEWALALEDSTKDRAYGSGKRGIDVPDETRRASRLAR
ncbi:hypothetical protein FIBSPDRAFT_855056 [Athelia psychrophila]|uniref:Uncharacterized protein n=1 Tax=Athelia psychrophila TaxID=1759441 RepID=A0A166PHR9_9AGAM|nr:hypothetical protein FIBSPDRAFT_855056 [Fibularhizoctonia sp. CBS 109695]